MKAHDREIHIWYNKVLNWELKLPRFQRHEAWDRKRISSLLNVIIKNLPLWVTLLLQVGDEEKFESRYIETATPNKPLKVTEHLLDWQQRLTALWRALNNNYEKEKFFVYIPELDICNQEKWFEETTVFFQWRRDKKWRKFPLWADMPEEMFVRWCIPFELFKPIDISSEINQRVEDCTKNKKPKESDNDYPKKVEEYFKTKENLKDTIFKLRETVKHFNLPYLELPSHIEKYLALEVFINMNTNSKPLSIYDIIVAEIEMQKWESLHDLHSALDKKYPEIKNYFDLEQLILYTSALIQDKLPTKKWTIDMDKKSLIDNRDKMGEWLHKMSQFLKNEGIFDKERLPTNAVLSVIAALYNHIPEHWDKRWMCELLLKKYLRSAFFTDRYENSAASAAYSDYMALKNIILWNRKKDGTLYTENDVLVLNRKEFPISTIDELISVGWPRRENIRARGILAVTTKLWAIDFADWQTINKDNILKRDYHHIFPVDLLNKAWIKWDLALNCTLLTAHTNRSIGNKSPLEYIKDRYNRSDESIVNQRLCSHLIPIDALSNWWYENIKDEELKEKIKSDFELFLQKRAKLIYSAVQKLINGENITADMILQETELEENVGEDILIQPWTPFSNRQNYIDIINKCEWHIYVLDLYFNEKQLEFLIKWINYNSIKNVKIITSLAKINEEFRNSFKYFKEELNNQWITTECRILTDKKISSQLHDRYLISKDETYIITSADIVARWQLSSIKRIKSDIPFDTYRNEWVDLINDWNKIKETLKA